MSLHVHRRRACMMTCVTAASTVLGAGACAQPVLDEQAIDEQAITKALTPDDSGGFCRNKTVRYDSSERDG